MRNAIFSIIATLISVSLIKPDLSYSETRDTGKISVKAFSEEKTVTVSDTAIAESPTSHLIFAGVGVIAIAVAIIALKKKLFRK